MAGVRLALKLVTSCPPPTHTDPPCQSTTAPDTDLPVRVIGLATCMRAFQDFFFLKANYFQGLPCKACIHMPGHEMKRRDSFRWGSSLQVPSAQGDLFYSKAELA